MEFTVGMSLSSRDRNVDYIPAGILGAVRSILSCTNAAVAVAEDISVGVDLDNDLGHGGGV